MVAFYEPANTDGDELLLVAAPAIAASITTIDDLGQHTRLRDLVWDHDWTHWAGDQRIEPARTVDVTLFAMAVDAARRGDGVLVGRRTLLEPDLQAGRLLEPLRRRGRSGERLVVGLRDEMVRSRLDAWVAASTAVS